ncbi:lumican-like, partial [Contarinia nasturtii]|uniref:lumican-like n=1 Tax=Contarinia nasturtii TaxID=265458 RepID=UPI0012D4AE97
MKMNSKLILFILVIVSIKNSNVFGAKYIGSCHRHKWINLTLVCVDGLTENNIYLSNDNDMCSDTQTGTWRLVDTINFENCETPKLPDKLFDIYEIDTLNMTCLGYKSFDLDAFETVKNIRLINASQNSVEEIQAGLFKDSKNIARIDLSFNKIKKVDPNAFSEESRLEVLNLAHNNIEQLSGNFIKKLPKLEIFQLSENQLTDIPTELKHTRLVHFNASHNKITEIPANIFNYTHNLINLDLSYNEIKS